MIDASLFFWQPLSEEEPVASLILEKLGAELLSWEGTPYVKNVCVKGMGVDCVRFVTAILGHLKGEDHKTLPHLPQDASMHSPASAKATMRLIRQLYYPNYPVKDYSLEPGDVIVAGPDGGGPGHALIVGHRKNEIWHSTGNAVHRTGMAFYKFGTFKNVFRVYRQRNREQWVS